MKKTNFLQMAAAVCIVAACAGCASTKVTNRERLVRESLPRPATIWITDFAATPGDVPSDSPVAGQLAGNRPYQTPEQIATGRELGATIAKELVQRIHDMGLSATRVTRVTTPQVNDLLIRGYLLSVNEGSAAARVTIGLGAGTSEMETGVEGYQVTSQGLRKLGSAVLQSEGNKTPGAALGGASWLITGNPAGLIVSSGMKVYGEASGKSTVKGRAEATAKEIASQLKKRFKEQGWID